MPVPPVVEELIARFDRNRAAYHAGQYNEAQVRQEFINPFWEALGWDVYNRHGYSERYKEVVHEDAIKVQGKSKAPDYAFRLGGQRVFFVEAKKPAVRIKEEVSPAYQLRRYAWSAKLPLSVLTDFEEYAVYDCRVKPIKTDAASTARVMYLTYADYPARWDEIAALFAPEAIRKGALDRYVASTRAKRGTAEVDAAFLEEIERWREALARNIALRNPGLTVRQLNRAVQMTIDRLIFLRICEDRGIEPYRRLGDAVQGGKGVYERLGALFRQADDRYDSGLFYFRPEKGRDGPADDFTLALQVDDRVLKEILAGLYYPDCPYEFSVLPADILGQVYEQFLGKVVRLTPAGRARVEAKPEVKKAGGVYYTPTYIVDYIVEHTVGRLLEGKTPRQVRGSPRVAPLRILDPACGSGTFLLQAYQYLLDWYLEQYAAGDAEQHARQGRIAPGPPPPPQPSPNRGGGSDSPRPSLGEGSGGRATHWRLTVDERKRILRTHIYGVDIDPQAVEVTKLSLLLKVLEGEEGAEQLTFLQRERALPDLAHNVRCGNSLIGPDYYEGAQLALFDEEEVYRVNAFDWKAGFGRAMMAGGFDAVLGNPPYIRIQAMKQWAPQEVEFYKERYVSASKGNYDIYVVFVEKGLSLLKEDGRLGYILPHKFFNARYGEPLRELIARGRHLADVVHFGDQQVFGNATTYTCLLFLDKEGRDAFRVAKVDDLLAWRTEGVAVEGNIDANRADSGEWNFVVGEGAQVFDKLSDFPVKLGDVALIFVGLQTSADKIYILEQISSPQSGFVAVRDQNGKEWVLERGALKPILKGVTVSTFETPVSNHWLIFPYRLDGDQAVLIPADDMASSYPQVWKYFNQNSNALRRRDSGRANNAQWYGYVYRKNLTQFDAPKLIVQVISLFGRYAYDDQSLYFTGGGNGPYYGIRWLSTENSHSIHYLQGLLGSKLLDFYLHRVSTPFRGGYWSYSKRYLEQLPIRTIDFSDPADSARHDRMVALVERMLALHQKRAGARTPQEKRLLEQQIAIADREIDRLVYDLYGLTGDEIAIVEREEAR